MTAEKKTKISLTPSQLVNLFSSLHERWRADKLQGIDPSKEEIEVIVELVQAISRRRSRGQLEGLELPEGWWVWLSYGWEPGLHMWKHLGMPRRTIWWFDTHQGQVPAVVINLGGRWPTVHVNLQAPQRLLDKAKRFIEGKPQTWTIREWESHEKFPERFYTQEF